MEQDPEASLLASAYPGSESQYMEHHTKDLLVQYHGLHLYTIIVVCSARLRLLHRLCQPTSRGTVVPTSLEFMLLSGSFKCMHFLWNRLQLVRLRMPSWHSHLKDPAQTS